jgi:hypothetical protein
MDVPEQITCVDCGQPAYRLSYPPSEGWEVGDYVAYRCSGCNDRWDMEVSSDVESGESANTFSYSAEARIILETRSNIKDD